MTNTVSAVFKNTMAVDLWDDLTVDNDIKKDETEYFFNCDPLAYLVKWSKDDFRSISGHTTAGELLKNRKQWKKLQPQLFSLDNSDLHQAATIREYYKSKLVKLGLLGQPLTPFRQRLYTVMNNDRSFKNSEFGVLYRVIGFYQEDTFLDSIMENCTSINKSHWGAVLDDEFEYVGNVARTTKNVKQKRYWFRNDSRQLACFYVESKSNSALPVLDQYLKQGRRYRIQDPHANAVCLVGQDIDFYAYYLGQNYTIEECV